MFCIGTNNDTSSYHGNIFRITLLLGTASGMVHAASVKKKLYSGELIFVKLNFHVSTKFFFFSSCFNIGKLVVYHGQVVQRV
jgi:hypothetical protein